MARNQSQRVGQRGWWLELLSYLVARVYHDRKPSEDEPLREAVEESVHADREREEMTAVTRTIAEMFREEGRKKEDKASCRQRDGR